MHFFPWRQSPKEIFKQIDDVGSIEMSSRRGSVIRNNLVGGFKFPAVSNKSNFFGRVGRKYVFMDEVSFNISLSVL